MIIFGETGVGKSSLINLILGREDAKISQDAGGCTLDNKSYPVKIEGQTYHLYDTAGLNRGGADTLEHPGAVQNLTSLVQSLAPNGRSNIHLLVFVVRCGRLPQTTEKAYKFLYYDVCKARVPIVLVVTGCENVEPDMDHWWSASTKERFERSGMEFDGHACVCADKGRMVEGEYSNSEVFEESREKVQNLILREYPPIRKKTRNIIFGGCTHF